MKNTVLKRLPSLVVIIIVVFSAPLSFGEELASTDESVETLSKIFEDIEKNGVSDNTLKKLEEFIASYPQTPLLDEAMMRLAGIYLERKEFEKAEKSYKVIIEKFPLSRFKEDAIYNYGYCLYREGSITEAKSVFTAILREKTSSITHRIKAKVLLDTLQSISDYEEEKQLSSIAAVLPLKGQYAEFGESALKGILLAADVFGYGDGAPTPSGVGRAFTVYIKDAADESLLKEVEDLLKKENIMGIIGPLLSKPSPYLAEIAQKKNTPAIILSQREGIPEIGDYVFRNFLTPKKQADAIANYAVKTLRLKKIAILYPESPYGRELTRFFRKTVTENDSLISAELSYAQGKQDFGEELKTLFGITTKERMEGRRRIVEYAPTVEIDALYIPDYYESVAQIAPYLTYYNIKGVQLLGGNGWNSPELLKLTKDEIEGSIFVDGFFPNSKRKETQEFVKKFEDAYGKTPGIIEAESYDSAVILKSAISASDGNPTTIKDMIQKTNIKGATGNITFDLNGEAIKELFILKVENGKIVEVLQ